MDKDFYTSLLDKYIKDPTDFSNNFDLGNYYYGIGQTATAVSFYLRAAERTNSAHLQYECMLKAGTCFALQGTRNNSVTGMYQHAIALIPTRPEGYFLLSRYYERTEQWFLGYTFATIGWELSTEDHPPTITDVEYPGKYGLLFEKAVTAWWCGLCDESRDLFKEVLYKYPIEEGFKESCIHNLKYLNSWKSPEQFPSDMKTKEMELKSANNELSIVNAGDIKKLKINFTNSDLIEQNYSEAFQDLFVLTALNGKLNGTYVEIGAGFPFFGNNTYLLESKFNWKGLSLDVVEESTERYLQDRRNLALLLDGRKVDYVDLFNKINFDIDIDYLQLDTDPPSVTYEILTRIPFYKHRFAVITYEHDYYQDESKSYREKSRKYLEGLGYKLIVGNAAASSGKPFEDWWVHPELVDLTRLENLVAIDKDEVNVKDLFLQNNT